MATAAEAVVKRDVFDPYLIDVTSEGEPLRPVRKREHVRALGPTVRKDLGKQTEGDGIGIPART